MIPKHIPYSKLTTMILDSQTPESKIRVYTYQNPEILKQLETKDYITCDDKFIDKHFFPSYIWMHSQMRERLYHECDLPLWAWSKKPNERTIIKHPDNQLRIIAEIPWKRILMSDFDLWHCVLNGQCISMEDREFSLNEIEQSWQKIFSFHPPKNKEEYDYFGYKKTVQLCIDKIYKHEIVSTKLLR